MSNRDDELREKARKMVYEQIGEVVTIRVRQATKLMADFALIERAAAIEECIKIVESYVQKGGDSSVRHLREHGAAWIADKLRSKLTP